MNRKTAIIIGAGPSGLTAAYELIQKTDIKPVIFEMSSDIGGISKTVNYKGNRIDIGGHRFFSKSERVMAWWRHIMPLQGKPSIDDLILKRDVRLSDRQDAPDPEKSELVLLVRNRISRIFFLRSFFDYPISLKWNTFKNLGIRKILRIGVSYSKTRLFPIRDEKTLEDFLINRFGNELYLLFFKDYTEKVWGVPCCEITADWGAQRIKGLSITKALIHAVNTVFRKDTTLAQRKTETSLIEQFTYPKLGPGQLWEEVARRIKANGGEIHLNCKVVGVTLTGGRLSSVRVKNESTNQVSGHDGDFAFSSMPVRDLIRCMTPPAPDPVRAVADGLMYRDFMTVGLLVKKMKLKNETGIPTLNDIVPDNWIYIQEREVKLGRLQIFNNWSPYLVKDRDTVWMGLEYFCNEGDRLWSKPDEALTAFAVDELERIGVIEKKDVLDSTVIRMPKTYPAYFGSYGAFHVIRDFTDTIENLFLVGRNGMHKYNNADHSMLTAMVAVENIINGVTSKDNIWRINTEETYHEEK
jgi:protoporphyrinogen oxidase